MYMSARVQLGINPFMFSWLLNPGDTFETPEAVMSYSPNGLNGMSQKLHDAFRTRLYRGVFNGCSAELAVGLALAGAAVPVSFLTLLLGYFSQNHEDDVTMTTTATTTTTMMIKK